MDFLNIIFITIIVLLLAYCSKLKLRQRSVEDELSQWSELKVEVSSNDIMQYIRETADSFRSLMESKQVDFSVRCTPESMMGWMDTDKIGKIIQMLLSDMARQATSAGKVTLDVYTNKSYDNITIRISDNGPKMSDIGFIIAHNLVHQHHGTIRNNYYEGQGNTVIIEFPIKKDAYKGARQREEQPASFHIPSNIVLNVPTIDLPTGYENSDNPLGAIIQQAYISADQEYLQRAVKCIHEHIMDSDYDRKAFAADMGSSVSTLYNKIRALTGKSITNFVRDIRIKKACRLAKENPDLRVSDIAYQVGFKDPKYFATSFKRVTGVQPKEYLLEVRGEKPEVSGER